LSAAKQAEAAVKQIAAMAMGSKQAFIATPRDGGGRIGIIVPYQ
jgi:hypothetical protein